MRKKRVQTHSVHKPACAHASAHIKSNAMVIIDTEVSSELEPLGIGAAEYATNALPQAELTIFTARDTMVVFREVTFERA
jgi:hypothetical protein